MSQAIRFGTDGWRGIIGEDFTFNNVRICALATANYLQASNLAERGLIIGYDTRFASENFAAAAAEVIAAKNIKVFLCPKPTPTPVISYGILAIKAGGAIIITASHNPALWNGFKFKTEDGASASPEVTAKLERNVANLLSQKDIKRCVLEEGLKEGLIQYLDLTPLYFEQIARLVNLESLRQKGLRIVVDSMFGAGAGYFKTLLSDGKTQITEINSERNPIFPGIQPEPIAKNLKKLSSLVKELKADVGLATDGDADRIGIIDELGNFLNPHQVFALLSLYLLEVRGKRGPLVKTVSSSNMLFKLGKLFNVPVFETKVGFPDVATLMLKEKAIIAGEESGGYAFRGHAPERDGILAGLCFLDFMVRTGKTPSQLKDYLFNKVGLHYYERLDFPLSSEKRQEIVDRITQSPPLSIADLRVVKVDTTDGFRFLLDDESWLLIRFSGTEPLGRAYTESNSQEKVQKILEDGRKLLGL